MNTKVIKFDLNRKLYEKIVAKQGDTKSRFLLFNLLDGSVPFDLTNRSVRVYGIKRDGTEIFNDLIVNNATKGYCTLELTNQMLALAGEVELELMIIEEDKKLTSNVFTLEVRKSINSEKAIVSTNEFTALLNGLASLNEYDNYKNEIKDARGGQSKLKDRLDNFDSHLEQIKYFVTPEMYGAKGDGVTDDTEALNNCFANNGGGYILSKPNRTYLISSELIINDNIYIDFNNSTIKATSASSVFKVSNPTNAEKIADIKNVIVDGNHVGLIGFYITAFRLLQLYNVKIKNCINSCIHVVRDSVTGRGSFKCDGLILENTNDKNLPLHINTVGIIFDSTDCKVSNVISNNFTTHLINNNGVNFIKNWHAWNLNSSYAEIINNSKFAIINNSISFDGCYSDTLQYAFYCTKNVDWINVTVNDFYYYINPTQYPSTKSEPLPIYNKSCILVNFSITNSVFNNEWNNYKLINMCNEPFNVSIAQSQLKGVKNQINVGKIKYRSFATTVSSSVLSLNNEKILHIKDDKLYLNLTGGLTSQINSGTDLTITITETTILSRYSDRIQNNIPCICKVKNGNKIYNVNAFYTNNVFYLSFPETISGGIVSLVMMSNYNASESSVV